MECGRSGAWVNAWEKTPASAISFPSGTKKSCFPSTVSQFQPRRITRSLYRRDFRQLHRDRYPTDYRTTRRSRIPRRRSSVSGPSAGNCKCVAGGLDDTPNRSSNGRRRLRPSIRPLHPSRIRHRWCSAVQTPRNKPVVRSSWFCVKRGSISLRIYCKIYLIVSICVI